MNVLFATLARRGRASRVPVGAKSAQYWAWELDTGGHGVNKPEKPAQADDSLRLMHTELRDLLNLSPSARNVLSHLAGVERALTALGMAAFEGLPSFVLNRAASQLESVLPDPAGPGITELRQRLAKALAMHEEARAPVAAPAAPAQQTAYVSNDQLQVSETTHTDFMRVLEASQNKY